MADTTTASATVVTPARGEWTYEDYLALPDDGQRYEIIEGVLYVTPPPIYDHQFASGELFGELRQFVKHHGLGVVLTAPFEVHLSETSRPVQPDVLFIRAEKAPKAGGRYFEGAPDLVIEVLSPATRRVDQSTKFAAYEQAGVREYWLVDPKTRSVQVFALEGTEYALVGDYVGDEVVTSVVLDGFSVVSSTLFLPQ